MLEHSQIARLLDIANAGCRKGMVHEARIIYEKVLVMMPGHAPARIGLAMSYIAVDDFSTAETMLRELLAENSDDAEASVMLGFCLLLAGRKDEAREILVPLAETEGPGAALAASLLPQLD